MPNEPDWVDRVAHIRAWSRNGIRAPHKPLLLLYALGRLQRSGVNVPLRFTEAEGPLGQLLADFGPPTRTNAGYPFHHLTSDGLWVVTTDAGEASPGSHLGALRASGAKGQLAPGFAAALIADPPLLVRIARGLLDANFPQTLHDDVVDQIGLDLSGAMEATGVTPRRRRSPEFRDTVLMAYELRCAICGWDGRLGAEAVGLEAAHVRWFNIGGPDSIDNGLCLCSMHHKLLDKGVIGITHERTVAVSARFVGIGPVAEQLVLSQLGKAISEPLAGIPAPAQEHIDWHTAEVFRIPARHVA